MTTETTSPDKALAEVRKEIDIIDAALHDLLMKRAALVAGVAEAKARAASAAGEGSFIAFRPGREAEVLRHLAERHSGKLPLRTIFHLWREIISSMTRIQGPFRVDVFDGAAEARLGFWDLARNYYGSSTPMELHNDARDVLRRVGQDRSAVGVLPDPAYHAVDEWWVQLAEAGWQDVSIVARLPFVDVEDDASQEHALVIAHSDFEPTGDDTSLVAILSSDGMSDARLVTLMSDAGLEGKRIGSARLSNGLAAHAYLFAVPYHLTQDDARLAALAGGSVLEARLLGGYANPLQLVRDGD